MQKNKIFLGLLLCVCIGNAKVRISSAPYISGDTFRSICNYVFDEDRWDNPAQIQTPSIVFVKTDMLDKFFAQVHQKIKAPYVLVSHNADHGAPGDFVEYLNDPKIIYWFGQNPTTTHPKFSPLPIGLANKYCGSIGNTKIVDKARGQITKRSLLYINIGMTHPERSHALQILALAKPPFFLKTTKKPFDAYLADMSQAKFILSPRGNGLDCHRTWEALVIGCIPIIKTSLLDPLFDGLPVLIVDDWHVVTKDFLEKKWDEFSQKIWRNERMFADYWLDKIRSKLTEAKNESSIYFFMHNFIL